MSWHQSFNKFYTQKYFRKLFPTNQLTANIENHHQPIGFRISIAISDGISSSAFDKNQLFTNIGKLKMYTDHMYRRDSTSISICIAIDCMLCINIKFVFSIASLSSSSSSRVSQKMKNERVKKKYREMNPNKNVIGRGKKPPVHQNKPNNFDLNSATRIAV